jgi:hypothetical protein
MFSRYLWIADLHTLQFTVTHAIGFSVFTSRILTTDFITVSLSLQIIHEVFFAPPNSFLAIIVQLSIQKTQLNSIPLLPSPHPGRLASRNSTQFFSTELFFITSLYGPRRKHSLSSVRMICLQRRCIATYSLPWGCFYRVVA